MLDEWKVRSYTIIPSLPTRLRVAFWMDEEAKRSYRYIYKKEYKVHGTTGWYIKIYTEK